MSAVALLLNPAECDATQDTARVLSLIITVIVELFDFITLPIKSLATKHTYTHIHFYATPNPVPTMNGNVQRRPVYRISMHEN